MRPTRENLLNPLSPSVSIVVVNYNGGSMLKDCVKSVRENTKDYEMIIVDNASTDSSLNAITPGEDVRIINLPRNLGFARANNIGIRASKGQFVVLLNSDTIVTPTWLDKLVSTVRHSPDIGLITPKLLRPGNPPRLDSTGHVYFYKTGYSYDRGQGEFDLDRYDNLIELPSCCFACTLIRREVFDKVGLLDPKMFFYFDDVDFGLRARIAGWRVVYCPKSIVYHLRGGSTWSQNKQILRWSRAYSLRIMLKVYQINGIIRFAMRLFLLDIVRVFAGVKNRDWRYAGDYAYVILWNLSNLPLIDRKHAQSSRILPDTIFLMHH